MSAATYVAPTMMTGAQVMINNRLTTAELNEIIHKIHALRRVTKATGFFTSRTIGEMLAKLSPEDLVRVGEALELKPREMPRNH
jgi:hypothetical protein